MLNFFSDNEDIVDLFANTDLRRLVELHERGYADAARFDYAPAGYEDAMMDD